MPKKTTTVVLPSTTPTAPKKGSQDEAVVNNPSHDILDKVVGVQPAKRQKKATVAAASASLEVYQCPSSSDHVSATFCTLNFYSCTLSVSYIILLCSP
jgi:hypothetical protein